MARTRAISIGIEAETLKQDMEEGNDKLIFNESFKIPNFEGNTSFLPEIDKHISNIEVIDTTDGKPYYYYKSGINWKPFDDKNTKKDPSTPRGMGQKALSNLIFPISIISSGGKGLVSIIFKLFFKYSFDQLLSKSKYLNASKIKKLLSFNNSKFLTII